MALLLLVPCCLAALVGLLVLTDQLERRTRVVLVRLTLRTSGSIELTEGLVSAELAPVLAAHGLDVRVTEQP